MRVPRGVAVTVVTSNGRVTASGFSTALSLRTDNGRAEVKDSSGPLDLQTDNGAISATGISAKKVGAQSSNGSVSLRFKAVPDQVSALTSNGRVSLGLPGTHTSYAVDAKSSNGKVDIDVPRDGASGHTVKVRTSNGGISVRVAN